MRIGIDISQIIYEGTGVANYTRRLIAGLGAIDKKNEYVFFGSSLRRQKFLAAFTKKVFPFPPTFLDFVWNRLHVFPVEQLVGNIDIFHSSDWTQPPSRAKKVTTIHDLLVYRFPEFSHNKTEFRTSTWAPSANIVATQKRRLAWVKKECDAIIACSQATKNDCHEILGITQDKIRVIYEAAGPEFRPQSKAAVDAIRKKYQLNKDYVLAVGTREPRKNLERTIVASQELKNADLVVAGKFGWGKDSSKLQVSNLKLLGYVPQEDLPSLYAGAKWFVYPSLYEGFGIPVLEAMACGCPVITSNVGSLPEVGGDAAIYVNPTDTGELAAKMKSDPGKNSVRNGFAQAKKFSWEKTAKETIDLYESL